MELLTLNPPSPPSREERLLRVRFLSVIRRRMSGSPRVVGEAKVQNMRSRRPEAAGEQTAGHTLALSVGRRHFEESARYLLLSNESWGLGSVSQV